MDNERKKVLCTATAIGIILLGGIAFLNNLPEKEVEMPEYVIEDKTKIEKLTAEEYFLTERIKMLKEEIEVLTGELNELIQEFDSFEQYIEVKKIIDEGKNK